MDYQIKIEIKNIKFEIYLKISYINLYQNGMLNTQSSLMRGVTLLWNGM